MLTLRKNSLALAYQHLAEYDEALQGHHEALAVVSRLRTEATRSDVHCGYATTLTAIGDTIGAAEQLTIALDLAKGPNARRQRANAHRAFGENLLASGEPGAIDNFRAAHALYQELGQPEAAILAAQIGLLTGQHAAR